MFDFFFFLQKRKLFFACRWMCFCMEEIAFSHKTKFRWNRKNQDGPFKCTQDSSGMAWLESRTGNLLPPKTLIPALINQIFGVWRKDGAFHGVTLRKRGLSREKGFLGLWIYMLLLRKDIVWGSGRPSQPSGLLCWLRNVHLSPRKYWTKTILYIISTCFLALVALSANNVSANLCC